MKKILSSGLAFVLVFMGVGILISKSVHADDGSTASSTPDVVVLSSDDTLSALAVSAGTLSPSFDPGTTAYTDVLPSDTTVPPVVTATTDCPDATETITQVSDTTGTAVVTVTAQDGVTTQQYSVVFSLAPAPTPTSTSTPTSTTDDVINIVDNSGGNGGGGSNLPAFSVIVAGGPSGDVGNGNGGNNNGGGNGGGQVLGASIGGNQALQEQIAAFQAQLLALLQQYFALLLSHGGH
jgi:hypothetical protein